MKRHMSPSATLISVAIACPLYQCFDYVGCEGEQYELGQRVCVSFGNRSVSAVIVGIQSTTPQAIANHAFELKPIIAVFDEPRIIHEKHLALLQWCANYYCHPLGECIQSALPVLMRKPEAIKQEREWLWTLLDHTFSPRKGAKQQAQAIESLRATAGGLTTSQLKDEGIATATLERLREYGAVSKRSQTKQPYVEPVAPAQEVTLNEAQRSVAEAIKQHAGFEVSLLFGVTGSGKTEVYISLVKQILAQQKQTLILVPEINLTPQTVDRFRHQLGMHISSIHSSISDKQRLRITLACADGNARVIIGTRSAVFLPFKQLGLIIVDEEHDSSYEQIDGFKYSARNVAIKRAQLENIPIVLGSATPSLESYHHAKTGKYRLYRLTERPNLRPAPKPSLIDISALPPDTLIAQALQQAIESTLKAGEQAMLFINRRGYSPALLCTQCHTVRLCDHCDARLTLHWRINKLICHHCNFNIDVPRHCEQCRHPELLPVGAGTQKVEQYLIKQYRHYPIIRFDRDNIRNAQQLQTNREHILDGEPCIIIGTQMIAKGHDFKNVTLVGVIDADSSFFSSDFKAVEHAAQQLLQVAGRSGRAEKAGRIMIQTRVPAHPAFEHITNNAYQALADEELLARQQCHLPPFSRMLTVRAEAPDSRQTHQLLEQTLAALRPTLRQYSYDCAGPMDAAIARKAGVYRAYLHFYLHENACLKRITTAFPSIQKSLTTGKSRLFIDVDPCDYT